MKKKENLIQTACSKVAGFRELLVKVEQKVVVAGKSKRTLSNYSRHLPELAIRFNELPIESDGRGYFSILVDTSFAPKIPTQSP